jgi:hypothetical protein
LGKNSLRVSGEPLKLYANNAIGRKAIRRMAKVRSLFPQFKLDELWREARKTRWTNSRELEITAKVMHLVEHLKEVDAGRETRNYELAAVIRVMADLDTQHRIKIALLSEAIRSIVTMLPRDKSDEIRQRISDICLEDIRS